MLEARSYVVLSRQISSNHPTILRNVLVVGRKGPRAIISFVPSHAKERLPVDTPLKQRRPRRITYDKKRSSLPVPEGSTLRAGRVSNSFTSA